MRLESHFVPEKNPDILSLNPDAIKPDIKGFYVEIGEIEF